MQQNSTSKNARPNVKPLVHWAIYKKYTLRFRQRTAAQVTGTLNTPDGLLQFSYDPQALSIHLPNQQILINEYGWELTQTALEHPSFVQTLEKALQQELPGRAVQYEMAPQPRPDGEIDSTINPDARIGARVSGVLILFYPDTQQLYLPLILRPAYEGVHGGQVSFPGGGREEGDQDLVATALREAHEEIGIDPDQVHIIGQLTPLYIAPSNYLVHPTVGWYTQKPTFTIDTHEVDQLIELPLNELLDSANYRQEEWTLRDRKALVPFFAVQNQTIWGATAMILNELLYILKTNNLPTN